jgi:hypothetical protein
MLEELGRALLVNEVPDELKDPTENEAEPQGGSRKPRR